MSLEHKLDGLLSKHDELQNLLATHSGMGGQEYARLSKEFTELNEIVRVVKIYREVESEIRNLNLLLDEDISDSEVKALAEEELRELKQQLPSLKHDVQLQLLPKDSVDKKMLYLKLGQVPVVKKPPYLQQIYSACTSASRNNITGHSILWILVKLVLAATKRQLRI